MNKTVLVVDDSFALRKLIRYSVNRVYKNMEYYEARDGVEALEILKSGAAIDVIITDINMPKMDGLTFLKEKMKDPNAKNIPTIVLSQKDEADIKLQALNYGIIEFLPKPFNVTKMKEVLIKILEEGNK